MNQQIAASLRVLLVSHNTITILFNEKLYKIDEVYCFGSSYYHSRTLPVIAQKAYFCRVDI
jgi:hypothetical protein